MDLGQLVHHSHDDYTSLIVDFVDIHGVDQYDQGHDEVDHEVINRQSCVDLRGYILQRFGLCHSYNEDVGVLQTKAKDKDRGEHQTVAKRARVHVAQSSVQLYHLKDRVGVMVVDLRHCQRNLVHIGLTVVQHLKK